MHIMILSYSHKSKTFDKIRERRGKNMKTKKLIFAALFAALTCVATMIIKVPTPTMGYIHPGDSIVLLSGFLLGPLYGGLAAGIGSMFSDLFGGYFSYAPLSSRCLPLYLPAWFTVLLPRNFPKFPVASRQPLPRSVVSLAKPSWYLDTLYLRSF